MMETSELTLAVEQAKVHNNAAITQLYEEYHNSVYFLCLKIVKNQEDALDLVQDSFLQAFSKLDTLQNSVQFNSWLNQIAANKCRDYLKKKKPMLFSEQQNDEEDDIEFEIEDRDESLIPDKVIDNAETRRLVMGIIEGLPDLQRMTVMLYYYEEKSVAQIADIMECSENTVKSRLNYARKTIKEGILALEKKGTKLYVVMPMLFPLIQNAVADFTVPSSASSVLLENITSSVLGSSVAGSSQAAGVAAQKGIHMVVSKLIQSSVTTKIIITAIAVVVVGGATAGIILANQNHALPAAVTSKETVSASSVTASSSSSQTSSKPKAVDEEMVLNQYLQTLPRATEKEQMGYKNYDEKLPVKFKVTRTLVGSRLIDLNHDGHKQLLLKYLHESSVSGKKVSIIVYTIIQVKNEQAQLLYEYHTQDDKLVPSSNDSKQMTVGKTSYIGELMGNYGTVTQLILQNNSTHKIYILNKELSTDSEGSYDLIFTDQSYGVDGYGSNKKYLKLQNSSNRIITKAEYDKFVESLKTDYKDITDEGWSSVK